MRTRTRNLNYNGLPETFRIVPSSVSPARCFADNAGICREVKFIAFNENTNIVVIGDADGDATSGNERGIGLKPGAVHIETWIDPYNWYVATEGDSSHGVSVTATK